MVRGILDHQQGKGQEQGLQQGLMLMMTWLSPNSLSVEVILAYFVNSCTVFKLYIRTLLYLWVLFIWIAKFLGHGHALPF